MVQIIPSIDLINQKVVRLKKGNFTQVTEYNESFPELVAKYIDQGFQKIHVVDLDGAKSGNSQQLEMLKKIPKSSISKIQWSGGLRSSEDFEKIFQFHLNGIVVSSVILKDFDLLQKMTALSPIPVRWALDMNQLKLTAEGWQTVSEIDYKKMFNLAIENQVPQVLVTSIQKDGLNLGADFDLYEKLRTEFPSLDLVASGGIRHRQDLDQLQSMGIRSAIVGRALLESEKSFL
jgi:phosphoribosylformimino-5-aminoimidazole carboxamide ribotide isomerase